jgi:phage shock protein C
MDPPKRLYRSESNRMVAGVCGGLGEFFGIDATLVRLVFVLLAFLGGSGIVAYLAMWLIVPSASGLDVSPRDVPRENLEELRAGVTRGARATREAFQRQRGHSGEQPAPSPQEREPPSDGASPPQEPSPR